MREPVQIPTERDRIADEILAIGVLSPLASPLSEPPTTNRIPGWTLAASLAFFAIGSVAFAATLTREQPTAVANYVEKIAPAPSPALALAATPAPTPALTPAPAPTPALAPAPTPARPRASTTTPTATAPSARPADRWDTGDASAAPVDGDLDALLDRALGARENAPAGVVTSSTLPETPTQSQVRLTLRALEGEVRACSEGQHVVVQTRIVVEGPTGRVTGATVSGDLEGTAARACVVRVLETARFPAFTRERFEIAFPYST
jgi:hypothetical protein